MGFLPEFDIELPSWLDWVRPLLQWPVGSETQWWDKARALRAAAAKAAALEPQLAGARAHTAAVLVGEAGQAVDRQYAKVFGGDASLPKSVEALHALADTAEGLGDQIQATKVGNVGLAAWAVGQLAWLAASAVFTGGASEAEVPVVEAMTEAASRQIAEQGAEKVAGSLLESLARSTVGWLATRTAVGVVAGAGMGVGQTLLSDGVLALEGHAEDVGTLLAELEQAVISMGLAGGATGVLTGQAVGALFDKVFGPELSRAMVVFKQALTGLTSAEAANVLATWAGNGQVGEATFAGGLIGLLEAGHHEGKPGVLDRLKNGLGRLTNGRPESPDVVSAAGQSRDPAAGVVDRPGEPNGPASTASDARGSANDGAPQAHSAAAPAASARATTDPGEHVTASADSGLPVHSDPGAPSSVASTNGHAPSHGDLAAGGQPRTSEAVPAAGGEHSAAVPDPAASPAAHATAGIDPAPVTHASFGSSMRDGTPDRLSPAPPVSVGPVADGGSPAGWDLVGQSGAAGVPADTPDVPRVAAPEATSTPPTSSDNGPRVGPSNPIPDARPGHAESSSAAGESAPPAGAPSVRTSDLTAAHAGVGAQHGDAERIAAGQAGSTGADAHLLSRSEDARGDSGRATDPLTTRRDPARPDSTRDDSNRPGGARPAKLPRRSSVARHAGDLEPAAAGRPRDPLAAADIGAIKASHDDSGPTPGELESHNSGGGGPQHSSPGTSGGGDGGYRGGAGDDHGGGDGGAGGGAGDDAPGQGGGGADDFARRQYLAKSVDARQLETRHAEHLGEVLDSRSPQRVRQFAEVLSARYDQYSVYVDGRIEHHDKVGAFRWYGRPIQLDGATGTVIGLRGGIFRGHLKGRIDWYAYRDIERTPDGERKLVVVFDAVVIFDGDKPVRGNTGIAKGISELGDCFKRDGVDRIRFTAVMDGALAWARQGTWDPDPDLLQRSLDNLKRSAGQLSPQIGREARHVLRKFIRRLDPGNPDLPMPIDVLKLAAPGEPHLGRKWLKLPGVEWHGVHYLDGQSADTRAEN